MKQLKTLPLHFSVALLFSQCYPAKMALHSDQWPTKEEYKVEGKRGIFSKERLQFGEFYTTQVKRSWTSGTNNRFGLNGGILANYDYTGLISVEYIKRKQTVHFSLTDAANRTSEVFCVANFRSNQIQVGDKPNSIFNIGVDVVRGLLADGTDDKYYVQIYTKASAPWELLIDNVQSQLKPKQYIGYLSRGRDEYYTVVPVREMEDKSGNPRAMPFGAIGFEFRNKEGKAVAAVSRIDKGVVYFQNISAEDRFVIANACAALLLQEAIG